MVCELAGPALENEARLVLYLAKQYMGFRSPTGYPSHDDLLAIEQTKTNSWKTMTLNRTIAAVILVSAALGEPVAAGTSRTLAMRLPEAIMPRPCVLFDRWPMTAALQPSTISDKCI
jgi:hypothetical protein